MTKKRISRKELKTKQQKTIIKMKENRQIDSNMLRDLITQKRKWAQSEKEKGLEMIKTYKTKIAELEKSVLRLEGIEIFIKDLLSPKEVSKKEE